ncbi:putative nucleic acid binding protein [Arabidopsis thaliana]|jgi:poly(rC)-binding protein 2/3/4|uniref:RNA-binding KH domain-containing protein PEPPER n=2 Tax=Arabidopsis thaliana TaxID=3702 RepID=PEP_ARATH|nr:RNA-binding KH domain-containing protein [Arabidopsis thaliana]Q9SZH4.1 RecName: Full=RNA-binding KH domain-containing protein PEPPER [Arabidopsis thaliana]AAL07137.1 putative nucleic acid binding protein [Arabidopsis thaliana]AAM20510.1 putative nucleic acid binding protein [Arabidopsis thaliana]AAM45112.1 putative nucleic acid binding protein [Arabidopsis thaliana]AEE85142.1 RNA-binding KH domain-containing protein [Arabidopsis thaliana]CAB39665.1 putative nucleic acid binding protein [A|eukprot:NP_194330.1 RNA-binding KH domain-containing protein [Arabidopsis thaliana]
MAAVADSVENNGSINLPENENLIPAGFSAAALLDENSGAFPELNQPDSLAAAETTFPDTNDSAEERWPGWPGDCVFRMIVPVTKVGAIIGRKGDFIKKMCEETRARIKVLDGPVNTPDRIVLISGKEEPEAYMSPAMDAVLRVFRRVSGLPDNDDDDVQNAGSVFSSVRLLVASTQAINLIGKQGSLIKSIVENSGASVRILSEEETPFYAAQDERIVDLQGEALKILKALEAIVGHLRRFLVDHTVVPLFEKQYLARVSQTRQEEPLAESKSSLHTISSNLMEPDFSLLARREPLFLERDSRVDSRVQPSGVSIYSQDPVLSARHSPGLARVSSAFVTQVSQTMQIPFSYAEDIIGVEGANIAYIRRRSGATITIKESPHPDQITVEIKGTTSQVQTAEQLIQEFIINHKEPVSVSGGYARIDSGYVPAYPPQLSNRQEPLPSTYMGTEPVQYRPTAYSQLGGPSTYTPTLTGQTYGSEYRPASDVGGYSSYNL